MVLKISTAKTTFYEIWNENSFIKEEYKCKNITNQNY
jgi:hypothetical protein